MRFLVTTRNYVAFWDGSNVRKLDQHEPHPVSYFYGLSYFQPTEELIYTRTAPDGSCEIRAMSPWRGRGPRVVHRYEGAPLLHQLLCMDSMIWVAATGIDSMHRFDYDGRAMKKRDGFSFGDGKSRVKHINSVAVMRDTAYVCAHNLSVKPGEIYALDRRSLKHLGTVEAGVAIHNCWPVDGGAGIATLASKNNELWRLYPAHRRRVGAHVLGDGYLRGVGANADETLIGSSPIASRELRIHGDGKVRAFDPEFTKMRRELTFKGAGQVYEIRLVGEPDAAHSGKTIPSL